MPRPPRDNTPVRITNEKTGGQKEAKPSRPELIPAPPLDELARVYGMGAAKYAKHNYLRGYEWGLSLGAAKRHIAAWESGEDYDPESNLHHLAHAAWHMFALMMFQWYGLGEDDRLIPGLEQGSLFDD